MIRFFTNLKEMGSQLKKRFQAIKELVMRTVLAPPKKDKNEVCSLHSKFLILVTMMNCKGVDSAIEVTVYETSESGNALKK